MSNYKDRERKRITDLFLKSRNYLGLTAFNLNEQMNLVDWKNVRDENYYSRSKEDKVKIIQNYLRNKRYDN